MINIGVISGSRAEETMLRCVANELMKYSKFNVRFYVLEIAPYLALSFDDIMASNETSIMQQTRRFIADHQFEYVVLLGDRWEIASVAKMCVIAGTRIIHLGGGEITQGAYDDVFRDWISRAAFMHFTIDEETAKVLLQKGCRNVCPVGSPRMDYLNNIKMMTRKELFQKYGFSTGKKTAVVVYHPETISDIPVEEQSKALVDALNLIEIQTIVVLPNFDKGADVIIKGYEKVTAPKHIVKNLPISEWASVLNSVDIMIGNSSAGMTETASYKLPTVNIGNRQCGRESQINVIDCQCEFEAIVTAVRVGLSARFNSGLLGMKNKFSDGFASKRIAQVLNSVLE